MRFSVGDGALAGLAGGAAMLAVVAVPGLAGTTLPLDVLRFWRGVVGRTALALVAHTLLSAAVGVLVGAVLAGALDADPSTGAVLGVGLAAGVVHAAVALAVLPSLLGRFPAALGDGVVAGRWCSGLGRTAVATAVGAHLAFGVVAALAYAALDG